jgi:hypothetical protein
LSVTARLRRTRPAADVCRTDRRAQGDRRRLVLVVVVVAVIYAAVIGLSVRHYGGNLSSLINLGQKAGKEEPAGLRHHVVVFRNSDGYDGQTYYHVADDPFLQQHAFRDAFRYQRIGYPLVVWAVSLGQRAWRPAAMVGVNVVAVLVVAYLSSLILLMYGEGANIWWALACAVNPSLIIGVQADLAEPMSMALSLAGLLLYLRQRVGWTAAALAAALLTREVTILFVIPLLAAEIGARRFGRVLALAMAVVPYLVWQAVLWRTFREAAAGTSQDNFGLPFMGIRAVVAAARHASLRNALIHQGSVLALAVLVCIALVVAAVLAWRRYDVILGGVLAHGTAALLAAPVIWIAYASAARVFGGLFPLAVFAYARHRTSALALLVGGIVLLTLFTFVRLVAISPTLPYYVTP